MGLLVVSSSVTMAVPFCMGKVIDVITAYDGEERATMVTRLTDYSKILLAVFIAGGIANAGRIYMIRMSGKSLRFPSLFQDTYSVYTTVGVYLFINS